MLKILMSNFRMECFGLKKEYSLHDSRVKEITYHNKTLTLKANK